MVGYRGSPGRPPNDGHAPGRKLTNYWLPAELKARLDREAYQDNCPAADIVALALGREFARRDMGQRVAALKARDRVDLTCSHCGKSFRAVRYGSGDRYCSDHCRTRGAYEKKQGREREA